MRGRKDPALPHSPSAQELLLAKDFEHVLQNRCKGTKSLVINQINQ